MSEFKYACPVCGQHIKCDSSQAGTQMECPTCFQKIIVPQAPTEEQKFILTGSKVAGERPLPKTPDATTFAAPSKTLPGVVVVIVILLLIGAAVAFVYRGTIFKSKAPDDANPSPIVQAPAPPQPAPPPKKTVPVMVAPPSNETNWTLNLKGRKIPDALAAGRIEGQDFVCQRATFQNGNLMLHNGELGLQVFFGRATTPDQLAGKSINVSTNTTAAARVVLRWQDGDQAMREAFTNQYAMLLNFGQLANNRMSGQIYICTSDDKKSYVSGTFDAEIRKPKPKAQ